MSNGTSGNRTIKIGTSCGCMNCEECDAAWDSYESREEKRESRSFNRGNSKKRNMSFRYGNGNSFED